MLKVVRTRSIVSIDNRLGLEVHSPRTFMALNLAAVVIVESLEVWMRICPHAHTYYKGEMKLTLLLLVNIEDRCSSVPFVLF